jgi:hypothetical protein
MMGDRRRAITAATEVAGTLGLTVENTIVNWQHHYDWCLGVSRERA